ncbi:MAG: hypothetical protein EAZ27_06705 [Cytophagales bacterium]|nr:MAG: hypothetical protein EAZ27_06705 [Cytophagales bacterium]
MKKNGFEFEPFTIENSIWRNKNKVVFVSVLENITLFELIQGLERAELRLEDFLIFDATF